MAREWTPAQRTAIDTRDRTLLLSAAAGSGKTAVLTERIISSLLDPEHPADISRMLIVTFTNAAAAELRARITAALQSALKENPDNRRLETQLLLLPSAEIRTINAFCAKFLRQNASAVGISPRFRIADEAEGELLARSVMLDLLSDCYEKIGFDNPIGAPAYCEDDFLLLADSLCAARDPQDVLADALLSLFGKCRNFPRGAYLLADRAAAFEEEIRHPYDESQCYQVIADYLTEGFEHYADLYSKLLEELKASGEAKLLASHGITYCRDAIAASCCATAMKLGNLKEVGHIINRQIFKRKLPTCSSDNAADAALHELRGEIHNFCENKVLPFLAFTDEDFRTEGARLWRVLNQLAALGIAFEERFSEEKRARNICQYSDLERLTLAALSDENGEPSTLALEKREEYDAVYIDEYQDVNEVQHMIFTMLSKPRNRFMVGDIKQSIYRFRGADPSIFAALRKSFSDYRKDKADDAQALFMQSNFRCDPPIIDFTNLVFDSLLGIAGESIGYREEDRLHAGKILPDGACSQKVRVLLTNNYKRPKKKLLEDSTYPEECTAVDAEAHAVAAEIFRLIREERKNDGSPIRAKDVTVLMKSIKGSFAAALSNELSAMGIPTETPEDAEFFLNPDVLLVLALLNVINNPHRDIYLAGVLRSPLYAFTMDELVAIREAGEQGDTLYDALLRYTDKHQDDRKCRRFLDKLTLYRDRAEGMPVWRLLRFIYDDTAILALSDLSKKNGTRNNLRRLYHYSRTFEGYSFRGLYAFLQFINRIIRAGEKLPVVKDASAQTDAVRLMTIHGSKGLEFPVCFVSHCDGALNSAYHKPKILFSATFGAALNLRTDDGLGIVKNPLCRAVSIEGEIEDGEEKLRLLYVALTRASERLYVTAHASNLPKLFRAIESATPSRFSILTASNFISLICSALPMAAPTDDPDAISEPATLASLDSCDILRRTVTGGALCSASPLTDGQEPTEEEMPPVLSEELLRKRFEFVYPHEASLSLPGKLSVSRLYPELLDEENETALPSESEEDGQPLCVMRPAFLSEVQEPDGAARGTATHLFLQFCRFDALALHGVDQELKELTDKHFISCEDASLVRRHEIERFMRSELFADLQKAEKIHRELRFHASLPAADFTAEQDKKEALRDERIFVQGVIDCVALYPDGSYDLIDYKTDRVPKDHDEAVRLLRERHTLQLSYYRAACTEMFGRPPRECLIYSLALGETVRIQPTVD